ncbi:tRNA (guanosine(37)-N1)-methyltransferase TrmD [Desulfuromonas sp. CSMB_57]|jgi:tRNA (guanine37-N1)-methyltransferase|uniref:tRNA (guanosine(37)-N1)-methyltransferase TrmD n=1 Tax=Desulfuromonas sp. CSMB_57 TaxID=2807629 RepID=UPI001CD5B8BB|nr:tRNA (guanosine(37)-N1)-methyltransferase TrmD [Desulfuromonas sp. CSMB_57]
MIFDVLTLFPGLFASPFADSILGKAVDRGLIRIGVHNLRDWAEGRHKVTDDTPYGGGEGMVLKPEPVARALADLKSGHPTSKVLLMTPQGKPFRQAVALDLAAEEGLIFVCGRYEGVDERVRALVDEELSLGDFVLTGGELAAMAMIDAIARLLPGVLGNRDSSLSDSHADGLLEYPQYTRPAEFMGMRVPEVLLSGNHAAISAWRRREQLRRTLQRRPDLLEQAELDARDRVMLEELRRELAADPE